MYYILLQVSLLFSISQHVQANGVDWINPSYALQAATSPGTADARKTIIQFASLTAKKGPFTVADPDDVQPPSGDPRDYLSWAPYWWPDCNWCPSKARNRIAHPENGDEPPTSNEGSDNLDNPYPPYYAMQRPERLVSVPSTIGPLVSVHNLLDNEGPHAPVITTTPSLTVSASEEEHTRVADGGPPPQAGAKKGPNSSCTPSPTTSMVSSATWTMCPYKVRDGKRNPDVRNLKDVGVVYTAFNSIIYNALAYVFTKSSTYSSNAARFIDVFFLSPQTGMNPKAQFGQLIRGPGAEGQRGTYQGILDMRWLAHVGNAVMLLKQSGAKDWNDHKHTAFTDWMQQYVQWLEGSYQGRQALTKANNHGTFYAAQLASIKVFMGDVGGAKKVITRYFETTFQDQIASNGNQPLEWSRTRPLHYVCFNLEAMITLAKLADQLLLNYWRYKSRYGATIQDAIDFAMNAASKAGNEDVTEVLPHVSTASAVYGDPDGKYAAFMQRYSPSDQPYYAQPWWFYNQPQAQMYSRKSSRRRSVRWGRDDESSIGVFKCPGEVLVIGGAEKVEVEYGLYVDCAELKPLYEAA